MAESRVDTPAGKVSLVTEGPKDATALVVLGHGAGGDMRSDFMTFVARGLARTGLVVARFNFAYTEAGRRAPDRQPVLEETFTAVAEHLAARHADKTLVLGGKSLGGRIASHVVASGTRADGLVFLGYPLHPPGRPDRVRDAHLRDITVPMLFVEGTRDPFCPLATLERVRKRFRARTEVAVIEGGDHSFKVPKSSGRSTSDAWAEAVAVAAPWIESQARPGPGR